MKITEKETIIKYLKFDSLNGIKDNDIILMDIDIDIDWL